MLNILVFTIVLLDYYSFIIIHCTLKLLLLTWHNFIYIIIHLCRMVLVAGVTQAFPAVLPHTSKALTCLHSFTKNLINNMVTEGDTKVALKPHKAIIPILTEAG